MFFLAKLTRAFRRFQERRPHLAWWVAITAMALSGCREIAMGVGDLIGVLVLMAIVGSVVVVFCVLTALLGFTHVAIASNLAKDGAARKLGRVGFGWLVVTIISAIAVAFVMQASAKLTKAGGVGILAIWVGPLSTGIASLIAYHTAAQIAEPGFEVTRRLRALNVLAGLVPLLVPLTFIASLVIREKSEDRDSAIALELAKEEEARNQAQALRRQAEALRTVRTSERERRMAECTRWVTTLDAPASSITIFDDPGHNALAHHIVAHTLSNTHLLQDLSLPCVDDELAPTFDQEERILAAYGRALVMSPEPWRVFVGDLGSVRFLAKRLHPAIPPHTAKDFAEIVDFHAGEVSRASYGRCYLARHLLMGARAPRMPRCENVEREFLKRESEACARWVTDLAVPQSGTYEAVMFEKGRTRTLAGAIARREVGDAKFALGDDPFVPPCMDIYCEGFVDHPAIEDAYGEFSTDLDLWEEDRLPPKRVVATVTRGRTIPKARARAFAIHAELFARERPIHFLEVALARCAAAKAYSKSEPRFVECDRLEAMVR